MKTRADDVLKVVSKLVPARLRDRVTVEALLIDDLGFDSMKMISLAMALEHSLGISVDRMMKTTDMAAVRTVGDIVAVVDRLSLT